MPAAAKPAAANKISAHLRQLHVDIGPFSILRGWARPFLAVPFWLVRLISWLTREYVWKTLGQMIDHVGFVLYGSPSLTCPHYVLFRRAAD